MWYRPTPSRALLVVAAVAIACGVNGGSGGDAVRDASLDGGFGGELPFIALASDFTGFRDWYSIAITANLAPGDSHINGPRHVYINQIPPPGSAAFPVGTIIVKETDEEPLTQRTVFASVKRGGGYDPTGDVGWEWFSLQNLPDGTESILWRGPGPASGGVYGNGALGGCNACHGAAQATDYVFTPQLEGMISPGDAAATSADGAPVTE